MTVDPIELCMRELPVRFAQAKMELEAQASGGDKRAQTRLADARASRVAARLVLEGEGGGELFVVNERTVLSVSRERPAAPAVHYALGVSAAAATRALHMLERGAVTLDAEDGQPHRLGSAKADQLFTMYKFGFELLLLGLPELGDVSLRIGLGRDLPAVAEFRLSVGYADLALLREQRTGPQELFSSGKLTITGDVAKAMMLGMTLAQLR